MTRLLSLFKSSSKAAIIAAALMLFGGLPIAPLPASLRPALLAHAQNADENSEENGADGEEVSEPRIRTLPPAYESQMLRLAEVMGALHYLRALCGANEGQLWREEMQKLLDAEQPTAERRAQLTAHFNRGFRGYAEIYRECTQPASDAANQFLRQGMRLAAEIPNRYGR